jgi:DNA-binding CsgD family transcriptional regulator
MYALEGIPSFFLKKYYPSNYKAGSQNWDLVVSPNGILYVANNSGLLTFDGNSWTIYEMPDNSNVLRVAWANDTIYTKSETSTGYWVANETGQLEHHILNPLPPHIRFRDMLEGLPPLSGQILQHKPSAFVSTGLLNFIGTIACGIYITNRETDEVVIHFSSNFGLPNNIVHALCIEDSLHIWGAFDTGLVEISIHSAMRMLGKRSDIGIMQDAYRQDSMLYIKTNTNYFKRKLAPGNQFIAVPAAEAIPYFTHNAKREVIHPADLIKDKVKHKELLTAKKIYRVSDDRYWVVRDNEAALVKLNNNEILKECHFLFDDFQLNLEHREEQIVPLNDSIHIISTIEGLLFVNTNQITDGYGDGLPFRFTEMSYKDKKGVHFLDPASKAIHLPHDYHELSIRVASSVFDPNNHISYKLDDVSPEWSSWQNNECITLLQLPEKEYTLNVKKHCMKAASPELTLKIHVLPPWYNTWWAYLIYSFLLGFMVWGAVYSYLKKQEREEKEALNNERQKTQQLKNKMLETELENKKNELGKQTSSIIRKSRMMHALLEELDRQKKELGDRYPAKLYQRMRSLMEKEFDDQNDWMMFETYFNSAHHNFIERFRQQYDDITPGDLHLCCLLRMTLSTKEIASILHISIRAVELRRYRLRKRIGLEGDTNLVDFLLKF